MAVTVFSVLCLVQFSANSVGSDNIQPSKDGAGDTTRPSTAKEAVLSAGMYLCLCVWIACSIMCISLVLPSDCA